MEFVRGPDFPTGGQLVGSGRIAYRTGRGSVKMRGEGRDRGEGQTQSIVVTELPYQVPGVGAVARKYRV